MNYKVRNFLLFSTYLNYFTFGLLLNSIGAVIVKAQNFYKVNEVQASTLEFFKDLPIVFFSFISAFLLAKLGHKKLMLIAMVAVTLVCISMAYSLGSYFWMPKVLFATIGASFAVTKISVYSILGLVSGDKKTHHKLLSYTEGIFMLGIATAYFLFPFFNKELKKDNWLKVYWLLAALSFLAVVGLLLSKEIQLSKGSRCIKDHFFAIFKLLKKSSVILFALNTFFFVMVEQSLITWLPTFNNKILNINENLSIIIASIVPISSSIGRIGIGGLAKYWGWLKVAFFSLVSAMLLILFVLSNVSFVKGKSIDHLSNISWVAYIFPTVGLFIAPIYPLMSSAILTSISKPLQGSMSGLIIIFSAIGGVFGSRITAYLFRENDGSVVFYYALVPMFLLLIGFFLLYKKSASE